MEIWIWIAVLVILFFAVIPMFVLPAVLYIVLLVRTKPEKWGRECSIPDDKEYKNMFDIGIAWDGQYASKKTAVDIVNDGYHLFGEYFDFGQNKAVIIIAGRMESLLYSYFFAEPYRVAGYNVLVIDNRSHGLSEGKVCSLGCKEYSDIIAWGKFLHDKLSNESVVLHGICIGGSTALFALTDKNCPDYMSAMVAEGMYTTFYESFKNHLIEKKKPVFPTALLMMMYIRLFSGVNVLTNGPIKRIDKLTKPILFIHSKQDIFSLPEKAQLLYNKCRAKKELVWFNKGEHSRVRINDINGYDNAIISFLSGL